MQLSEILEENSIKSISQKTKISEENLENLLAKNFDLLMKTKALGFISILEREYNAELDTLRDEALEYYASHDDDHSFSVAVPIKEEKKGRSKLFLVVVLGLLGYASWYFFTQFDKKHLSGLIPFQSEQTIENPLTVESEEAKENLPVADLTIESAVANNTKSMIEEHIEEISVPEANQSTAPVTDDEVNDTTVSVSQF